MNPLMGPARLSTRLVEVDATGCWLWTGRQNGSGYGRLGRALAHRVSYETFVSKIPEGLELDHLCKTPLCINPEHLEPVTRAENIRRRYAEYNTCAQGHTYNAGNTYMRPSGHRDCRVCIRERARAYQARKRAAA